MHCIFCRVESGSSRSIEHIIPESLGNKSHILAKGIVCDKCNNYFSREVEKPFLESKDIKLLRFHQALESKNGRIPSAYGVIWPDVPVHVIREAKSASTRIHVPEELFERISIMENMRLIMPLPYIPESGMVISRFLAKVGLEAMAFRLSPYPEGLEYICNENQFDQIRNHTRKGMIPLWPVSIRRIYDANGYTFGKRGVREQILHEFDFLMTSENECYFVLAIFGVEFSINIGGTSIKGYTRWLAQNNNESPLYSGKNSFGDPKPLSAF